MKPEHFSRHEQYMQTAKLLESAHRSYLEALRAIEEEQDEVTIYSHVKKANSKLEEAFPEKFAPLARPVSIHSKEETKGRHLLLIFALAVCVIGTLLVLTLFGPTGDMTKTWNMDDVQKNTTYPKSQ